MPSSVISCSRSVVAISTRFLVAVVGAALVVALLAALLLREEGAAGGSVKKVWQAKEFTLAMVKPDAVRGGHTGAIIDRTESEGFEIVALKKTHLTLAQAKVFYAEHKDRPFFTALTEFMSSGPVVVMLLSKDDAVASWRALIGATNPTRAAEQTMRRLYGLDGTQNAVHGSDAVATAIVEGSFFFPELLSSLV